MDDSSTRSWDAVADDWVAHADTNDYRNALLLPFTLELLGDVRGLRILDLGCGEGAYGRALAARGALVIGVDGSAQLVRVAKQRAAEAQLDIEYLCVNASSLVGVPAESFDVVLAAMMLMDVEDYESAVQEVWRVLRPGGVLVMSITHPCFSAPISEWVTSESGELQVFNVDRYFDRVVWDDFIAAKFRRPVLRRHRPLEDFMRPLLERRFVLRMFREPDGSSANVEPSSRLNRLRRIPYFLFMSWAKTLNEIGSR